MSVCARCDLHLHSKYSGPAADWLSRRLEFPASCAEPRELYRRLREERGFEFFTLTDHNSIAGCLEVGDLPGVFVSEEVTAQFPEDGVKVHVLVYGITEEDHREIQGLRGNVYELCGYLRGRGIFCAVAHPFESPDEKLTAVHLARLLGLFAGFEVLNGRYAAVGSECAGYVLRQMSEERVRELARMGGVEEGALAPWRKVWVGGSNDGSGLYAGVAWTETPPAGTVEEFLEHLRQGRCQAKGLAGSPLRAAHGFYSTAIEFAKRKLGLRSGEPAAQLLEKIAGRFLEGRDPTEFTLGEKLTLFVQGVATGKIFDLARAAQTSVWKELAGYFGQPAVKASLARVTAGVEEPERRAFLMANLLAGQIGSRLFGQALAQFQAGRLLESLQMVTPLLPLGLLLGPYLQGFRQPRRVKLRELCVRCGGGVPECLEDRKRAWFTDTLEDVNGVSTTIRRMVAAGVAAGKEVEIITSRSELTVSGVPIKNFAPAGEFALPEYELQRLSFPPVLEILEYLERERFTSLIISTPGPVGLTALLAAELLGLPSVSIYHTDFPQYVGILTDDAFMESLTWSYMRWFYSRQELVFVNSEDYRRRLAERGIAAERLRILPRGLDTRLFHPMKRNPGFWPARGLRAGEVAALYVGRVSKEKNLDLLVAAAREMERRRVGVRFLFVGDGPYRRALEELLPEGIFTGYLSGEELAAAYASADFFVFPSTTDTFGNVILEAQASGLPCVVSDLGGPRDLVSHGEDGLITRALDAGELCEAIERLATAPELRARMGAAARAKVEPRDWGRAFEQFWAESPLEACPRGVRAG